MVRRVIIGGLIAAALLGAGIAIGASTHGWGPNHDTVVVHGTGGTPGQTIVVTQGHGPHGFFFFPFGLLFLVLVVFLVSRLFRRGSRGDGGCGPRRGADESDATGGGAATTV